MFALPFCERNCFIIRLFVTTKMNNPSSPPPHHSSCQSWKRGDVTPAASLPLALQQQSTLSISFNDNSEAATVKIRLSEMCDTRHIGSGEVSRTSRNDYELSRLFCLRLRGGSRSSKSQLRPERPSDWEWWWYFRNPSLVFALLMILFHNKVSGWLSLLTISFCVRSQTEKNLLISLKVVFSGNLLNYWELKGRAEPKLYHYCSLCRETISRQ